MWQALRCSVTRDGWPAAYRRRCHESRQERATLLTWLARGSACAPSPLPRWSAFDPPAAARSARVDAALQGGRLGRLRAERRLALGGRVGRRGEAEVRQGRQLREAPIKPRRHMASRQRPAPHRPGYLEPSAGRRLLVAAVLSCDGRSRVWPAYPRRCNDVTAAGAARGATGAAGGRFGDCEWLLAPMTSCVQDNV